MPMIDTKVSVPISTETEERMKEQLGKAIALLPGKSEKWLMLRFGGKRPPVVSGESSGTQRLCRSKGVRFAGLRCL